MTWSPRATRALESRLPTNPAAPVTNTRILLLRQKTITNDVDRIRYFDAAGAERKHGKSPQPSKPFAELESARPGIRKHVHIRRRREMGMPDSHHAEDHFAKVPVVVSARKRIWVETLLFHRQGEEGLIVDELLAVADKSAQVIPVAQHLP